MRIPQTKPAPAGQPGQADQALEAGQAPTASQAQAAADEARGQAAPRPDPQRAREFAAEHWLELVTAVSAIIVVIVCLTHLWPAPQDLDPLLAVPPALAGIGAATLWRPLTYGAAALVTALLVAAAVHDALSTAAVVAVAAVTALSVRVTAVSAPKTRQMANVLSVAETAQRAVLRPIPGHLGPVEFSVVYLAAAADAKVGGDLYDVAKTPHGIRLIIGDVRGKGLGAVEVAADVLGMYREVAHEVHTLAELARRLDAGLARRWGQHEEFVTALLAEIDPVAGRLTIYSCGHPPPILFSSDGVTVLEVPAPAPPLGLLTLGDGSGAARTLPFKPNDQLLLYTDGVTEARDRRQVFYPLDERLAALAASASAKVKASANAASGDGAALLEAIRDDLLRHAGAPLEDDAALMLVRAPAAWPAAVRAAAASS